MDKDSADKQTQMQRPGHESGDHNASETDERDIHIHEEVPERKPIKNILVVDDEISIRRLLAKALESDGYDVIEASDGEEGMKLFRENPADLIITDIVMPKKGGHDFINEILEEFPDVKIIAISGKNFWAPR